MLQLLAVTFSISTFSYFGFREVVREVGGGAENEIGRERHRHKERQKKVETEKGGARET